MLAVAAIATSCSNDGVVNQAPQDNAIQFGAYLGNAAQSRGSVADLSELAKGFGVFAYYTGNEAWASTTVTTPNFMNNQQVTGTEADGSYTWSYSPVKYWPNNEGDKVSFFAYAPYDADKTASANGQMSFTVANTVADQIDLLWNRTEYIDVTKQALNEKINFNFGHALAKVGLTVQCAIDQEAAGGTIAENTTITVNEITLAGATATTGVFHTTGTLDMAAQTNKSGNEIWTVANDDTKQYFTYYKSGDDGVTSFTDLVFDNTDNAQKANESDYYLMLIPQDFSAAGSEFYVHIDYTVVTTDNALTGGNSTINNKVKKAVPLKLEQGKAYTLNLVLGMNSVDVSAEIDEWDTATETTVDLPKNDVGA